MLNYDCLRDLMLYLARALTPPSKELRLSNHRDKAPLSEYEESDIMAAVLYAVQKSLIIVPIKNEAAYPRLKLKQVRVSCVTAAGQDFVRNVAPDSVWKKIKRYISDNAVDLLTAVASVIGAAKELTSS